MSKIIRMFPLVEYDSSLETAIESKHNIKQIKALIDKIKLPDDLKKVMIKKIKTEQKQTT